MENYTKICLLNTALRTHKSVFKYWYLTDCLANWNTHCWFNFN